MATRHITANSDAPLWRLTLRRITKSSHASGQDRLPSLLFDPNRKARLHLLIWELNQCNRADVTVVVQDRFSQRFRQPEKARASARGRRISKEDDETWNSDEDDDEVDGELNDRGF
ncbi:hypothetical protein CK203_062941 [Vitis vinifera]|uniref:Uncharacterized protein n=1 Tax=Vitis vinifera TaxID=29760 RepID=A0A438G9Q1_VITVI|nr:hypothetical protein CK203_062941 [Vitis vinifera]